MNSPVALVDAGGEDAVAVVDKQLETITIKATYIVNGTTYSFKDFQIMKSDINNTLNNANHSVSKGIYSGYSVNYDLDFVYSTQDDFKSPDSYNYEGINIGNEITKGPSKLFKDKIIINYDGIRKGTVGGITQNYRHIAMNPKKDSPMHRIHEIYHTLFYNNDNARSGIGKYGTPEMPNQKDIDGFINNENLPKVIR
jgi:hypothetical protein